MVPTLVGFHCKITYNNCAFLLRVELCQECVRNCRVHAVPVPSTTLSKKLNTVNNIGVGIMDTNLG